MTLEYFKCPMYTEDMNEFCVDDLRFVCPSCDSVGEAHRNHQVKHVRNTRKQLYGTIYQNVNSENGKDTEPTGGLRRALHQVARETGRGTG